MSTVGQIEKRTQARVVALFRDRLHYDYLGNRIDRDNRNLVLDLLRYGVKVQPGDRGSFSLAKSGGLWRRDQSLGKER